MSSKITCPVCKAVDSIFIRQNSDVLFRLTERGPVLDSVVYLQHADLECSSCNSGIHPKEIKEKVKDFDSLPDINEKL